MSRSEEGAGAARREDAADPAMLPDAAMPTAAMPDAATTAAVMDALSRVQDGLLLMNRQWQITYANTIGRRISRVREEDLNGPDHWQLYPATVGTEIERFYRSVMEGRTAGQLEFFYPPFEAWLKVSAFPTDAGIALYYSDTTELHRAAKERDVALQQMEQAFAVTDDAVVSLNREWTITFLNKAGQRMTAPAGDVLGQNLWHAFPELVYEGSPFVSTYYRAMVQRESGAFDAFYPAPLNVWLHVEVRPAEEGIVLFARDVTRQHKDEEALRTSEQKYRLLTELGPMAIWRGDADGSITYANTRFLDYIGEQFAPGAATAGVEWFGAIAAEADRERAADCWRDSVQCGKDFDCEALLVRASDGAERWWHLRAQPLRDDAGAITQWLGVADEIHDRKMTSEHLRQERAETERQRRELEAIYDTAPVGLALFEPKEFRYLRVNQRQAETLGQTVDNLVGRRIDEIVSFQEVPHLLARVAAGETIRDYSYQTEMVDRPGEVRTLNVNYSPVYGEDGAVSAISAAVLDVTQQQKAESALRQSEKLAAVGRLASSISHEINNPLEAVTNLLYLTAHEPGLNEAATAYVRMAQDEVRRVSQIATQTLRFHRQQNSPTSVTPAQLVDPVLNLFHGRLVNSRIHVEAAYSTVRSVLCFEGDIRQILNNLIANAIDAMRNGGRLIVRAHDGCDLRSGNVGVRITVADTGHGMNEATLRRVFEPFYTTKELNGNGLGLWISQGIVERHQGQLRVRSTQDQRMHGTVFSLFLPSGTDPLPSN